MIKKIYNKSEQKQGKQQFVNQKDKLLKTITALVGNYLTPSRLKHFEKTYCFFKSAMKKTYCRSELKKKRRNLSYHKNIDMKDSR